MELRAASGQVNVARISSISESSGRVSLPVARSQTPYAQFKYVQGIPSASSNKAVPISRLRMLNSLINSLVNLQNQVPRDYSRAMTSDSGIEALIDRYSDQLYSALQTATPYSVGAIPYTSGSLLDIQA